MPCHAIAIVDYLFGLEHLTLAAIALNRLSHFSENHFLKSLRKDQASRAILAFVFTAPLLPSVIFLIADTCPYGFPKMTGLPVLPNAEVQRVRWCWFLVFQAVLSGGTSQMPPSAYSAAELTWPCR